jgi:tetratricopeptide (TPR) repeat protein
MIDALVELLGKYYANDDLNNVETIARSILAAVPDDQVSLQFIGLVYYRSGKVADAIRLFDRISARQKPANDNSAIRQTRRIARRDHAATACYEAATRQNPDLAKAWHDLGMTLLELGRFAHALRAFECSTLSRPEFPPTLLAMARTAVLTGDLMQARHAFLRVCELQPENSEAHIGLAHIHRRNREFDAARERLAHARKLQASAAELAA